MKVSIKSLNASMEIKHKGIELEVYDNQENHLGDLVINKAKLTWCKGRTTAAKGVKISWEEFIKYMQE